jgi:hypothetical protein
LDYEKFIYSYDNFCAFVLYYKKNKKKQLREMLRKILSKHWWIVRFRCNILELPLLIFSVVFIVIWWLLKKLFKKKKLKLFLDI